MVAKEEDAPLLPEDEHEIRPGKEDSSTIARDVERLSGSTKRKGEPLSPSGDVHKKKQERGQNKARRFNNSHDEIRLCPQKAVGKTCDIAAGQCKYEHDLVLYISKKPEDIGAVCSVYETTGHCDAGFRCRWLSGHVTKGVVDDPDTWKLHTVAKTVRIHGDAIQNDVRHDIKIQLRKKQYETPKSTQYLAYLDKLLESGEQDSSVYVPDVPLRPVEKRRLNWSSAKVLAPLTTTGNLPFRQLCREFGADVTYSEMAVSAPLLSGNPNEWALTRSHISERDTRNDRQGMYGIQLAGPKPAVNLKAAEVLSDEMAATLDFIDLNCGCRKHSHVV